MRSTISPNYRHTAMALLATTMLVAPAMAQDAPAAAPTTPPATATAPAVDEDAIVITATKRSENLQDVPIAITALTTKTLDDLQVNSFDDYARLVPSLSYKSSGPGSSNVYFRGVASGENGNHSSSLPSVGTYLDEQPITTIQGALDIHVFDIARVEALAGPQGTLYGASSQAGTVRIITNKPDFSGLYGAVNLEVNSVSHGGIGYTGEGFINIPIATNVAARIVAWNRHDAGYIDNIAGSLTFPSSGIVFNNARFVEKDYNDVDTYGARAALRIDLDDNWTITPQIMAQRQVSNGSFAEESGLKHLQTMQFNPERFDDKWAQGSLTVQGKIGNFDVTYAGAYMERKVTGESDYVDYAYFYDALAGYGNYFYDNGGNLVNPNQYIQSDDKFTKQSHELRFTSPSDKRLRVVGGLFYQRQTHHIVQNYIIDNIADSITVPTTESNIWLTNQFRVDRDYAVFGEVAFDITPKLTITGGGRLYKFDNTLVGFFGFRSPGYSSNPIYNCSFFGPPTVGGPCNNVDKRTKGDGFVHRLNLTYKPNDDLLFYATWSRGFRPGGINRRGSLPPYQPDFLNNYEAGAKISFGRGSHFNFAVYQEDWKAVQLSFLGANGLTEIRNAGDARIRGLEADLFLKLAPGLTWSTGASYNDAKILDNFCRIATGPSDCSAPGGNELLAPGGTQLPLTAKFKGNSRVRYEWNASSDLKAHVQAVASYEGKRRRDLRVIENEIYGNMKAYAEVDFSAGLDKGSWSVDLYMKNAFDSRGQISKSIQCAETVCGDPDGITSIGPKIYTTVTRPRTIGLRIGRKF
ncbi:TonB-dependent receptor domain-containing protein [Sphingomonas sp.]|uniref:TonB-dependent receptor n=1 Tax=Sphingomonas sp. TaxID=28214 RepID=UPI00286BCDC6|nr:TonB-dependent receptor [Sphingomonas sp.]